MTDPHLSPAGLFQAVYAELRRIAAAKLADERAGHTLDATALVHEAYLRLAGTRGFAGRSEFLRAAAEAMRRILIDHARRRLAAKRGGGRRFELDEADRITLPEPETVLAIDEALGRLAGDDPAAAEMARLRLFAGLSVDEAAEALGVSRATGFRDWAFARAYLTSALARD